MIGLRKVLGKESGGLFPFFPMRAKGKAKEEFQIFYFFVWFGVDAIRMCSLRYHISDSFKYYVVGWKDILNALGCVISLSNLPNMLLCELLFCCVSSEKLIYRENLPKYGTYAEKQTCI